MSEHSYLEDLGIQIPDPHPFELTEEERMEKYQKIGAGLEKGKTELLENFSNKYTALKNFFDWLNLVMPNNNYAQLKDSIIESAKCFTDCAASFDTSKMTDEEWCAQWNNDQKFWHKQFEENLTNLFKVSEDVGQEPELETMAEIEIFISEKSEEEQANFHLFCAGFAKFVACKKTIWQNQADGDDGKEKVPVEKK